MSALSAHIRAFQHLGEACVKVGAPMGDENKSDPGLLLVGIVLIGLGNALAMAATTMKAEESEAFDRMNPQHDKATSHPATKK